MIEKLRQEKPAASSTPAKGHELLEEYEQLRADYLRAESAQDRDKVFRGMYRAMSRFVKRTQYPDYVEQQREIVAGARSAMQAASSALSGPETLDEIRAQMAAVAKLASDGTNKQIQVAASNTLLRWIQFLENAERADRSIAAPSGQAIMVNIQVGGAAPTPGPAVDAEFREIPPGSL
jgi:hypothetical protein